MLPWSSFDLHNFCTGFCEKMFEIKCPVQEMQIYLKKKRLFCLFVSSDRAITQNDDYDLYRFTLQKFVGIACSLCMIDTPMSSCIKDRGIPWQILMQKSSYYIVNSISDGIFHLCKRFQGNSLSHLGRGTKDYGNSWGDDGGESKDNFNWNHFAEGLFFWRAMFFFKELQSW